MTKLRHRWLAAAAFALAAIFCGCNGYPEMPQPTFGRESVQRKYENGEINYTEYVRQMRVFDPNFNPPPPGRTTPAASNPNSLIPPPQPGR